MLQINDVTQIYLGVQGENGIRTIQIDVSAWAEGHESGSFSIWHKRNGDASPSATGASYDPDEKTLTWTPTGTDTYIAGEGLAEIRMTESGVIQKSRAIRTCVSAAVTGGGTTIGSDWQSYINEVDRIKSLAVTAELDAENAASDSEAYAKGTRGGDAVDSDDPAYHNNSKYYSEQAAESASAAGSSKDDAVSAKNDAVSAKVAAQAAKTAAESAKDDAISAKNNAVSAKNDAVSAKNDAVSAKNDAASSKDDALSAKNTAVSAKNDAVSARDAAINAKNAAENAAAIALSKGGYLKFEIDETTGHLIMSYTDGVPIAEED